MNTKRWFSLIALFFIVVALTMFLTGKKESSLHDYFWIPLVLSAVFLFASTRVK